MTSPLKRHITTGIKIIDQQHDELIRVTNNLFNACMQGKGKNVVRASVSYLETYIKKHFSAEEQAMKKYSYVGYEAHRDDHTYFARRVSELRAQLDREGVTEEFGYHVNKIMNEWMIYHLSAKDTPMAEFLRTKWSVKLSKLFSK